MERPGSARATDRSAPAVAAVATDAARCLGGSDGALNPGRAPPEAALAASAASGGKRTGLSGCSKRSPAGALACSPCNCARSSCTDLWGVSAAKLASASMRRTVRGGSVSNAAPNTAGGVRRTPASVAGATRSPRRPAGAITSCPRSRCCANDSRSVAGTGRPGAALFAAKGPGATTGASTSMVCMRVGVVVDVVSRSRPCRVETRCLARAARRARR